MLMDESVEVRANNCERNHCNCSHFLRIMSSRPLSFVKQQSYLRQVHSRLRH